MRIGWLGKGFLLEDAVPEQLFVNVGTPGCSCWRFERPYRIYPGQRLRATIDPAAETTRYQGIVFQGVRVKDDLPVMIHDGNEALIGNGTVAALAGESMQCPADSAVDLYSVTIPEFTPNYTAALASSDVQIWGPDDREWFRFVYRAAAAAVNLQENQWWLNIPGGYIELGEERGWIQKPGETFVAEFENLSANDIIVASTIRGSVEGEDVTE